MSSVGPCPARRPGHPAGAGGKGWGCRSSINAGFKLVIPAAAAIQASVDFSPALNQESNRDAGKEKDCPETQQANEVAAHHKPIPTVVPPWGPNRWLRASGEMDPETSSG